MNCERYRDLVAADVDGVLGADEQQAADAHVASCEACREARRDQAAIRDRLRALPMAAAPEALRQRIVAALDAEDAAPQPAKNGKLLSFSRRRFLLVGALAASFALMVLPLGPWNQADLVGLLVHDAQAAERGEIELAVRSAEVDDLRAYFAREAVGFERTVPDLRHRGYTAKGSVIDRSGPAPAAVTVFEGAAGRVVCRRYQADEVEIPADGERIGDAVVVTRDGVTMRFVRDGDSLCCLASTMPRERFLEEMGLLDG